MSLLGITDGARAIASQNVTEMVSDSIPFQDPSNSQYGIISGNEDYMAAEAARSAPVTPRLRGTAKRSPSHGFPSSWPPPPPNLRGSAQELRERNAARLGQPLPTPAPPEPEPSDSGADGEADEDILTLLSKSSISQRRLALEDYVFEQHAKQLPLMKKHILSLEERLAVLSGEYEHSADATGSKTRRYEMSQFSSPALAGSPSAPALTEEDAEFQYKDIRERAGVELSEGNLRQWTDFRTWCYQQPEAARMEDRNKILASRRALIAECHDHKCHDHMQDHDAARQAEPTYTLA